MRSHRVQGLLHCELVSVCVSNAESALRVVVGAGDGTATIAHSVYSLFTSASLSVKDNKNASFKAVTPPVIS